MDAERRGRALFRADTHDPQQVSRALGVVFLCGAALVIARMWVAPWDDSDTTGLYTIGVVALVLGLASVIWANRARSWTVHTAFAIGTALVSLGVYFSGLATGTYSVLFVWLVVMGASFFSTRAMIAQVLWILVASAVAIGAVDEPGVSPATRWVFGSLLLLIAAIMMGRIAAERRSIEARLRREIEEKGALQRELEHLAHHDPLTALANRRRLDEELGRELARSSRQDTPLSVIALDLDGFKEYNDAHGHVAGDRLLKRLAGGWSLTVRAIDVIARLGGDEFVVLLPDCPPEEAELVAQRLCERVPSGVTCSAGTACWDGAESTQALLARADRAMYEAKRLASAAST